MNNDITKTAVTRALFTLVSFESTVAFFYFTLNNPEMTPFLVGIAIFGVLSAVGTFFLVRTPESTRRKWYPLIYLVGAIASVIGCCCALALIVIGALQGQVSWMSALQVPLTIYVALYLWSRRQAALRDNSGMSG